MWEQEKVHRQAFEQIIKERRVRPSLLYPLWHCAGYALGAGKLYLQYIYIYLIIFQFYNYTHSNYIYRHCTYGS